MNTTQRFDFRTDQIRQILEMNGHKGATAKSLADALLCTVAQANRSLRVLRNEGEIVRPIHGASGYVWVNAQAWSNYTHGGN